MIGRLLCKLGFHKQGRSDGWPDQWFCLRRGCYGRGMY